MGVRLEEKVAIITGGAGGIGRAAGARFVAEGARVLLADVDENALGEAVAEIGMNRVSHCVTDVTEPEANQRMVALAEERYGGVDILLANAGTEGQVKPITECDVEVFDRVIAVNVRGVFLCCRAVFPHMQAQGKGKIVNISSGRFWEGTPNRLHYSTSKAGVIGLTRSLAREVGEHGITVNAITPGFTLSDTQVASSGDYARRNAPDEQRAIRRHQFPDDLVGAVMFLISDASDYITGQTLNVDGGRNMH